jgi:hypothetical protein
MNLFRTSLLVVLSCAVMSVQAASLNVTLDPTAHKTLSKMEKNPSEFTFAGVEVYKLTLLHGGCGNSKTVKNFWDDCVNDRQRIELASSKEALKTFNKGYKKLYYRFNLLIPSEKEFPDLAPMKQMIHQVKLPGKHDPVWSVYFLNGMLRVTTDNQGQCLIDAEFVPRQKWLEIEIFANYDIAHGNEEPSLYYAVNGAIHCKFFSPLITKNALRDATSPKMWVKYGIYNTFPSKWLLSQSENREWIKKNNITFASYQQDYKGQSGELSSELGTPFDYDWPVKLPTQTIYFTEWEVADSRNKLTKSRFEQRDVSKTQGPQAPSTMDFSASTSEICGRAIAEWKSTPGEWAKAAESRGLSAESCKLFLK